MSLVKEDDRLFVLGNNFKMQLWFTSETECFVLEQKANWRFTKDLQGKVNGIFYKEETFETTAKINK
jgi:hypothetical protein